MSDKCPECGKNQLELTWRTTKSGAPKVVWDEGVPIVQGVFPMHAYNDVIQPELKCVACNGTWSAIDAHGANNRMSLEEIQGGSS